MTQLKEPLTSFSAIISLRSAPEGAPKHFTYDGVRENAAQKFKTYINQDQFTNELPKGKGVYKFGSNTIFVSNDNFPLIATLPNYDTTVNNFGFTATDDIKDFVHRHEDGNSGDFVRAKNGTLVKRDFNNGNRDYLLFDNDNRLFKTLSFEKRGNGFSEKVPKKKSLDWEALTKPEVANYPAQFEAYLKAAKESRFQDQLTLPILPAVI